MHYRIEGISELCVKNISLFEKSLVKSSDKRSLFSISLYTEKAALYFNTTRLKIAKLSYYKVDVEMNLGKFY